MSELRIWGPALMVLALASCGTRTTAPPPQPAPLPLPIPAPPPPPPPRPVTPPPAPADWRGAPLSMGAWTYRQEGPGASLAAFGIPGQPSFTVRCEPNRQVTLTRSGTGGLPALTIRTDTSVRALSASQEQAGLAIRVPAGDRILDALAFSRGRFTVEVPGMPMLVVPAWPEPARVIEDCRS